jgi:hypothetical protein
MASQVFSGSGSFSYTNNTGQNVRIVINYMGAPTSITWAGISVAASNTLAIGRNLAFSNGIGGASFALSSNNGANTEGFESTNFALPTELILAPGQTFSAACGAYNVVFIPEAG